MEVVQLVVNDIEIFIKDQPIGLGISKLSLDRDFQYSCIDTKIEAELKFYCASGKTEIDNEYENKGVEGSGYIIITDTCGTNAKNYQFNLDFKKYNNQGDYTTLGLIDVNSLWKLELNKEVNLTALPLMPEDFYVRNLPLTYDYHYESSEMNEKLDVVRQDLIWPPIPTYSIDNFYIFQKSKTTKNELDNGSELLANQIIGGEGVSYTPPANSVVTSSNGVFATTFTQNLQTTIEIEPIFDNIVDDGILTLTTSGDNGMTIDIVDTTYAFQYARLREHIIIGSSFENPRILMQCNLYGSTTSVITSFTNTNYSNNFSTGTHTEEYHNTYLGLTGNVLNVKKGEKVWFYYSFLSGNFAPTSPITINGVVYSTGTALRFINYKEIDIKINRDLDLRFTLTKNVSNGIVGSAWIEPYHTKTKAYKGSTMLNAVFGCDSNIASEYECYSDLWFSRGDYLRGKINAADFIVKPSEFFTELEKVVCCGLGYFYDLPDPYLRLRTVYDFYSDILVPSKYQFDYNDLIDGKIEIAPFSSPYYKEIQIGYSNSKDSPKDFCKQNNYSINNASDSIYSKVSDFIASMFIITRALRLGTEDKELEFDKNIILLSGTTDSGYNVTLSQTGGYLDDKSQINPTDYVGINRRYSTVFNLFRHLYKWGFSLFADKDKITANKYEGNTIYDNKMRDTSGAMAATSAPNKADNYFGLSNCYLPYDNPSANDHAPIDKSLEDIYDRYIVKDLYVPTQITFKTANLSSLDLIEMRAHQYDLFSVTDGTNMYYGNLISANLEDDITEIKLLRRFKNGI